jgi:hypothetical protein
VNGQSVNPGFIQADLNVECAHETRLLDELEATRYGGMSVNYTGGEAINTNKGEGSGATGAMADVVDLPLLGNSEPVVDDPDLGSRI